MFGGGIDGDGLVAAMQREIFEELEYTPVRPRYFSRFEDSLAIYNVFIEEIGANFENDVHVREGKYGTFLTLEEIVGSNVVAPHVVPIISDLENFLS